jgi:hypothetical protein
MALDNIPTVVSSKLNANLDKVVVSTNGGLDVACSLINLANSSLNLAGVFLDTINQRVGIGTNAPARPLTVVGSTNDIVAQIDALSNAYNTQLQLRTYSSNSAELLITGNIGTTPSNVGVMGGNTAVGLTLTAFGSNNIQFYTTNSFVPRFRINNDGNIGAGTTSPTAKMHIQGSGSTSATTSLLVQNSAGNEMLKVTDDGSVNIGLTNSIVTLVQGYNNAFQANRLSFYSASTNIRGISEGNQGLIISKTTGISDLYPSAILAIDSTTQGFLPPRMTTTQKNAIATPAAGLMVYDTTLNKLCVYTTAWETITSV